MSATHSTVVAEMPITWCIDELRNAWKREREWRVKVLSGENRKRKLEEVEAMLAHCDKLEQWCRARIKERELSHA